MTSMPDYPDFTMESLPGEGHVTTFRNLATHHYSSVKLTVQPNYEFLRQGMTTTDHVGRTITHFETERVSECGECGALIRFSGAPDHLRWHQELLANMHHLANTPRKIKRP